MLIQKPFFPPYDHWNGKMIGVSRKPEHKRAGPLHEESITFIIRPPSFWRTQFQLPQRARKYLDALLQSQALEANQATSVIVFGSAVNGAFSENTSDVDLIIMLRDNATAEHRHRLHEAVVRLEIEHGFRSPSTRAKSLLERFADHAGVMRYPILFAPGAICSRGMSPGYSSFDRPRSHSSRESCSRV